MLADRTVQGREPHAWARAVIAAYHEFMADRVVAEVNQGGDLVVTVLRQIDAAVAVRKVHATRGKWLRAEPIAALYAAWKGVRLTAESTPQLLASLKAIPAQEVRAIYRERYWKTAACIGLQPALALMHFDTAVNHGPGTAIRILQEVVRTEVDGDLGPNTLAAISRMPMDVLLGAYAENRRQRYRAMAHFWRFGRGWLNRVDATLAMAQRVAREPATSSLTKGDDTMTPEVDDTASKWWGSSMTIWGALTTGLAALLPALGPLFGLDLTADLVAQLGSQSLAALQAIVALAGTFLTITGRTRAFLPLARRAFNVRL